MSPNIILLLQSLLIVLQMINAALATSTVHTPQIVSIILAAVIGGFQFYMNHIGNQTVPPGAVQKVDPPKP